MAEAVVSLVVESVGKWALKEAKLLSGVSDSIDDAKAELQQIRRYLADADSRAMLGDPVIRNHVAEIREASYDLEDVIIAAFDLESSGLNWFSRWVHNPASRIDKITSRISKSRASLHASGVVATTSSTPPRKEDLILRRTFSHNIDSDFVGFENDVRELVACLTSQERFGRVVSICGMGGLGKTTLARQVYHHADIRRRFDCFAWAFVSQKCQPRDVWEGILLKLTSPSADKRREIKDMGDEEIAKALYNLQKEKRCLVVLDDIWTTRTWDILKPAFPSIRSDSKLLFTTRDRGVAFHADPNSFLHEPKCFNHSESWELFVKKTHFGTSLANPEGEKKKENLGRKMLEYCDGLPLAITVLGGLLSSKETVDEWEILHNNINTYMRNGKLNEHESTHLGVSWVLGLSYDELPCHLKPCFLHLAYFPEDFEIRAKDLCRIWIAEGFISSEEQAYECLSELVQRCIVQVAEWGSTSTKRIKTCRIHDLMRDLCLSLAQEENFLQTVNLRNKHEAASSSSTTVLMPTKRIRRLAIHLTNKGADELLSVMRKMDGCLRSLICFNPEPDMSYEQLMKPILERFRLLRVLKFENLNRGHVGTLPEEIGELVHLRLLSLRDSYVKKFPSSIGNLRSLETLDLRVKPQYNQKQVQRSEIPPVLWKLVQLRHLYLPHNYFVSRQEKKFFKISFVESILRLDTLTNLETLVNFSVNNFYLSGLGRLTKLRKLKVKLECKVMGSPMGLENLRSLAIYCPHLPQGAYPNSGSERQRAEFSGEEVRSLILSSPRIYKLHLEVALAKLPECGQFSPNLMKLTLVQTFLKHDPMEMLGMIPSLRILVLDYNAFSVDAIVCSAKGFPRLESLSICYLDNLKEWTVEEGALPSLRCLRIVSCLRLKTVPEGLRHVITLKEVVIQHMLQQFKKRVERGGEDFYKLANVPSLLFTNTLDF